MRVATLDIRNTTRRTTPRFAYQDVASYALPGWEISLAFVGETRAASLNRALRKKTYVPNVLSYESGPKSGEIIICLAVAEKQAKTYGRTYQQFVGDLFIHGISHLKGYPHGPTMERYERALTARFTSVPTTHVQKNHRRRH